MYILTIRPRQTHHPAHQSKRFGHQTHHPLCAPDAHRKQPERRGAFLSYGRAQFGRGPEGGLRYGLAGHRQRTLSALGAADARLCRGASPPNLPGPAGSAGPGRDHRTGWSRVEFHRRAHLPIVLASGLCNKPIIVPWWPKRKLLLTTYDRPIAYQRGRPKTAPVLGKSCSVEIQARMIILTIRLIGERRALGECRKADGRKQMA